MNSDDQAMVAELRRRGDPVSGSAGDAERKLLFHIGQLRHAYSHLAAERVVNQRQIADGLLSPAIAFLEALAAPRDTEAEEDDRFERGLKEAIRLAGVHGSMEPYARDLSGRLRQMDKRAKAANKRADETERLLADSNAVHMNMLRGSIARPSVGQIIHIYGADVLRTAVAELPLASQPLRSMVEEEDNG